MRHSARSHCRPVATTTRGVAVIAALSMRGDTSAQTGLECPRQAGRSAATVTAVPAGTPSVRRWWIVWPGRTRGGVSAHPGRLLELGHRCPRHRPQTSSDAMASYPRPHVAASVPGPSSSADTSINSWLSTLHRGDRLAPAPPRSLLLHRRLLGPHASSHPLRVPEAGGGRAAPVRDRAERTSGRHQRPAGDHRGQHRRMGRCELSSGQDGPRPDRRGRWRPVRMREGGGGRGLTRRGTAGRPDGGPPPMGAKRVQSAR